MYKKILLAVIIAGVLAGFGKSWALGLDQLETGKPGLLWEVFQASNAELMEIQLDGWGRINEEFLTANELTLVGQEVMDALGVAPEQIEEGVVDTNGFHGVHLEAQPDDGSVLHVFIQSLDAGNGNDTAETYLLVSLLQTGNPQEFASRQKEVASWFCKAGVELQTNTVLVGVIREEMDKKKKETLVRQLIASAGAVVIEGLVQPDIVSLSGYTQRVKEALQIGDHQINLNIALRDTTGGETLLFIGSPLITIDY